MNLHTRRWLLTPSRQLRTRRLMAQHGPTLPYTTAWALITLASAPDENDLVRAWATENANRPPGVHYDQWDELSPAEQTRRRQWLQRHAHSPVQLLHLDADLIKSTGLHITDWGHPTHR